MLGHRYHKLKKMTRKSQINVFEIVEAFKQEQAYTEVIIALLATGAQPPRRPKIEIHESITHKFYILVWKRSI